MNLTKLLGTDLKERIKKSVFRFKNLNFAPYTISRTLYGTRFAFYVGDRDGEAWYIESQGNNSNWLWPEMEFIKTRLCSEGDVVIECGGHHGLTAVVISQWIGKQGQLYSFEPNPHNIAIMQKNVEINQAKNVIVVPKAVGASEGNIRITNSSTNSYILKEGEHTGIDVPVVTIDSLAEFKPTLLKIDVEGFEAEVLKGAGEVLKTFPKLAIELHPDMLTRYGSSTEELLSLIDERYSLWIQWDIYQPPIAYRRGQPITHRAHLFAAVV